METTAHENIIERHIYDLTRDTVSAYLINRNMPWCNHKASIITISALKFQYSLKCRKIIQHQPKSQSQVNCVKNHY